MQQFPEATFKVVEEKSCPMYALGDAFTLSGNAFTLPQGKAMCITLINDITEVLVLYENIDESGNRKTARDVFDCTGCSGVIRVEYVKQQEDLTAAAVRKPPKDITAITNILKHYPIFESLGEENLKELVSYLRLKKCQQRDVIIRQGDAGRNLYILLNGKVEVIGDDGIRMAVLGKGDVFGEMSLLSGESVGATIMALEPVTLLYMNGGDFNRVLAKFPSLQMYFARLLAKRLAQSNITRAREIAKGMAGSISEMLPTELLQTLNSTQKTGVVQFHLEKTMASMSLRDGEVVNAAFLNQTGKEAFFSILRQKKGRFNFLPELPPEDMKLPPLGDFMGLLMEGVRRIDEDNKFLRTNV